MVGTAIRTSGACWRCRTRSAVGIVCDVRRGGGGNARLLTLLNSVVVKNEINRCVETRLTIGGLQSGLRRIGFAIGCARGNAKSAAAAKVKLSERPTRKVGTRRS